MKNFFHIVDFIFSRFNKMLKLPDYTPEEYQAYFQGKEKNLPTCKCAFSL